MCLQLSQLVVFFITFVNSTKNALMRRGWKKLTTPINHHHQLTLLLMTLQGILEILLFLIINKLNHSNSKEISNDYDMQLVSK